MAACAILYLPSLFWALGLDQNIFAEIGSLLLKGKRLYVDAWDVKPPNVFYVYAFFEWIFGTHDFTVRISDYIFTLLACASLFFAVDKRSEFITERARRWIAPMATVLLVLTLLSIGLADTAQTESYSLLFIIASTFLVQRSVEGEKHYNYLLFAGVAIGVATFFKTTNAVFLLPIVIEIWLSGLEKSKALSIFVLGFLTWCAIQVGILWISGSLVEFWKTEWSVFTNHPREVSSFHYFDLIRSLWTYLDIWVVFALLALGVAFVRKDKSFLRAYFLPTLLLLAGVIAVVIQNKGWGYQYVVILPGLSWLSAISAVYLYETLHSIRPRVAIAGLILISIVTLTLTPSARRRIHYADDAIESITNHPAYLASLGSPRSLYYPPATDSLAQFLKDHTLPNETVFIFGEEPGAYWRADRLPASRYVYSLLFTSGVISRDNIIAFQNSLIPNKPSIIVIQRFDTTMFRRKSETSESILNTDTLFRPVQILLDSDYGDVGVICGKFRIYHCSH